MINTNSASSIQEEYNSQMHKRIENWKCRLIDLSKRNNLLYFKQSKRSNLAIINPDALNLFNKLVLRHNRLEFLMPPETQLTAAGYNFENEERNLFQKEKERPLSNRLVCEGVNRKELDGTLKNLHRRSLSDYRERGIRILHVAFGILTWKDIVTLEEIQSPLIMVPVELSKETIRTPFAISVPQVEEEVVLNPALQVKLKKDYKIDLPPLPEEWENDSLTNYFNLVNQIALEQGWKLEKTIQIGLFSFHKLVIYNDLDTNSQIIIQHPIIRAIAGIKDSKLIQEGLPEEKDVDIIEDPEKTFRVLDADSSQRVSIDYALKGQSFVMQGPPGTGKSQTIANIIAECIAQGKSVLFVSDKMAALEVVYKRLSDVGLAHFCLELHSSKANKQEVVAELKRCLDEQLVHGRLPSAHEFEKIKQLRNQLNDYVSSLHLKQPLLQKSAYEVLGELSKLEQAPFVQIGLANPGSLTPQRMHELEELVSQLKAVWQVVEEDGFPWRGYRGNKYDLEVRSEITTQLEQIISTLNLLRIESGKYAKKLGLETPSTIEKINWLLGINKLLLESVGPEISWVMNPKIDQLISEATNYREIINQCQSGRNQLLQYYNNSFFSLILNISSELEQLLSTLENLVIPTCIKEGDLLKKRESLLNLAKNTPARIIKWKSICQELTTAFGLPNEDLCPERVTQLARIATFCFSENKPEKSWFNLNFFQQTEEIVRKAKKTYGEYNSLQERLKQEYTDRIYDLNLDEYLKRYKDYQSALRIFNPNYYRDQKEIALITHNGKVPKTVLKDLLDAQKVKTLKAETENYAQLAQTHIGHFYQGYETDFQKVEKAIEITKEIQNLAGTSEIPENLVKLVTYPSIAPQEIKKASNELNESVEKWQNLTRELVNIIPVHLPNSNLSIDQTQLNSVEEWTNKIAEHLTPIYELTKEIMQTIKNQEPKNYSKLLEDLKLAENIRKKEAEILNEKEILRVNFGSRFLDLSTNWAEIITVLQWTKNVKNYLGADNISEQFAQIISQGPTAAPDREELLRLNESTPRLLANLETKFEPGVLYNGQKIQSLELEELHKRIKSLRDRIDDLQKFIDFKETKSDFTLAKLDSFLTRLIEKKVAGTDLINIFRKGAYQEWLNNLYDMDAHLGKFRRDPHEQMIADFRKLDEELIRLSSNKVIEAANSRKPQDVIIQAADSEITILLKEAAKKRRLMPIRNLLQKIPHILTKLKPCMLMSPISVSQFLNSEAMKFDLILFDEASQIVPEDAICSIFRGKTIVVAGDNKQLPPTSFFQKSLIDDLDWDEINDAEVEVFDSILDECLGIGLPVKTLRWHYRSRHEDLIAFSNNYFYDGDLITFPSAEANHHALGVKVAYVPNGVYDRGGRRDNIKEAEVVADLVFEHFAKYPKKTLGVVTFSIAQMETIEDVIEKRLNEKPEFEPFFREDRLEGFFVKNLENVQGDERDFMIFSVGYGRDQKGVMTMNFGPLNKPGGERRLNVAVTRAREKTLIVTSIKSSEIDSESTRAAGVTTLRHYLEYAEKGPSILKSKKTKPAGFDTPLEDNIAEEIRNMEYEIETQVGCSEYRIDIAVIDPVNPGCYLLGIECDGPTYRSSTSARDRDRLREQVLNQLGWKIHRVWSPEWIARKESELRRLKEALEQSCQQPKKDEKQNINENFTPSVDLPRKTEVKKVQYGGIEKIGVPYKIHPLKATFESYIKVPITKHPYIQTQKNEFHFPTNRAQQSRLLAELVEAEGPIHFDYAVQRLAEAWDLKRIGPKAFQAVKEAADMLLREKKVVNKGNFLWPTKLVEVPVRLPVSNCPHSKRRPEHIAPEEIESAIKLITQYALGISVESLISETAKVFGYNHFGEKIREVITEIYQKMLRERKIECINDTVTVPE